MECCRNTECGDPLGEGDLFCRSCGTRVGDSGRAQEGEVLPARTSGSVRVEPGFQFTSDYVRGNDSPPGVAVEAHRHLHQHPGNVSVVLNTPQPQQNDDMALMLLVESRKKSGWLAAFLNLILPGAGYIYCGRWFVGILALLIFCSLFMVLPWFLLPWFLLAWVPAIFIDGFLAAGRHNRAMVEKILRDRAGMRGERW